LIKIKAERITEEDLYREIERVKSDFKEGRLKENVNTYFSLDQAIIKPKSFKYQEKEIDINGLLAYKDEEFIKKVFEKILLRQPDREGFNYFLNQLRSGKLSKRDIIFRLRYSKEGRQRSVKIKGLFPKGFISILSFIPILNSIVSWLKAFVLINRLNARLNYMDEFLVSKYLNLNHRVKSLEDKNLNLNHHIFTLEKDFKVVKSKIFTLEKDFKVVKFKLSDFLEELEVKDYLEEKVKLDTDKNSDLYFSFESMFRGNETDIKERLSFYLRFLKKSAKPVLDIGCGRCEFLRLLKEKGINGVGVDINKAFVKYCKSLGIDIDVEYEDALEYLKKTNKKFSNITMFHIIEHLDIDTQLSLLKEVYSKLENGGKVIIETPNPIYWNSFASFYTDPTHIKPIPATTLAFYLERIGFDNLSVIYLHPDRKKIHRGDKLLRYYQDYVVIGEKPKKEI